MVKQERFKLLTTQQTHVVQTQIMQPLPSARFHQFQSQERQQYVQDQQQRYQVQPQAVYGHQVTHRLRQ